MRLERVGNAHKKVEDERQAKRQAKSEKKRLDMINMMENLGIVESRVATSLRELVSSTTAAGSDKKDAGQGKVSLLPSVGNNNKSGHGVKLQIATSSTTTHAMATTWVSNKTVGVYQQAPSADRIGGIVVGRSSVALADSIQKTSRGSASSAPLKHKFVVDGIDLRELLLMKDEDEFFSDLDDD